MASLEAFRSEAPHSSSRRARACRLLPVADVVGDDAARRFPQRLAGAQGAGVEAPAGQDEGALVVVALEGVLPVGLPAVVDVLGRVLLAHGLEVEGMEPGDVLGLLRREVVVVGAPHQAEAPVEGAEVLGDGHAVGPFGEFVGVEPQPPDMAGAGGERHAGDDAVHEQDADALLVVPGGERLHQGRTGVDGPLHGGVGAGVVDQVDGFDPLGEGVTDGRLDHVLFHPCPEDGEEPEIRHHVG